MRATACFGALLLAASVAGCGGEDRLETTVVQTALKSELQSRDIAVQNVLCVPNDDVEKFDCSVEYSGSEGSGENLLLVRCRGGACTWLLKGDPSEGGAFPVGGQ